MLTALGTYARFHVGSGAFDSPLETRPGVRREKPQLVTEARFDS